MLSPLNTPRGKLLSQYVCVRIVKMDRVNIGLFDYDRYNTLYFFLMNADEQIYMRYGGRDEASPTSYLNLKSLELALEQGLELHKKYQQGEIEKQPRPEPLYPEQIPALFEATGARGRCVECHLIGDFSLVQKERDGALDKLSEMFRSPEIKKIGIHLDIPNGLVVDRAEGAVAAAGMQPGDRISALNGKPVWTFGDLQHVYNQVDRRASRIELTVERDGRTLPLDVELPEYWWWTSLGYRQLSVDPRVYFRSKPLSPAEKRELGLPADSFASRIEYVDSIAALLGNHELKVGDIITAVDGARTDEIANTAELFIKLRKKAGSTLKLDVIRAAAALKLDLRTNVVSFRK